MFTGNIFLRGTAELTKEAEQAAIQFANQISFMKEASGLDSIVKEERLPHVGVVRVVDSHFLQFMEIDTTPFKEGEEVEVLEEEYVTYGLWMCWPSSDGAEFGWGRPYNEENAPWGTIQGSFSTSNGIARICNIEGDIEEHDSDVIAFLRDWRQQGTRLVLSWNNTGIYSAGIKVQSGSSILCACVKTLITDDTRAIYLLWVEGGDPTYIKARAVEVEEDRIISEDGTASYSWSTGVNYDHTHEWWWEFSWNGSKLLYNYTRYQQGDDAEVRETTGVPANTAFVGPITFDTVYEDEDIDFVDNSSDSPNACEDITDITASKKLFVKGQYDADGTIVPVWLTLKYTAFSYCTPESIGTLQATHPEDEWPPEWDAVEGKFEGFAYALTGYPGCGGYGIVCSGEISLFEDTYYSNYATTVKLEIGSKTILEETIYSLDSEWHTYRMVQAAGTYGDYYHCHHMKEGCTGGLEAYFRFNCYYPISLSANLSGINHIKSYGYVSGRYWVDARYGLAAYAYTGEKHGLGSSATPTVTEECVINFNGHEFDLGGHRGMMQYVGAFDGGYGHSESGLNDYFDEHLRNRFLTNVLVKYERTMPDWENPIVEEGAIIAMMLPIDDETAVFVCGGKADSDTDWIYENRINSADLVETFEFPATTNPKIFYNASYSFGLLFQPTKEEL